MHTGRSQLAQHKPGIALIAVIWLIAILSLAAITTLRVISFDAEITTAKVHGLTLVTRNEADVAGLGAAVLNPFT